MLGYLTRRIRRQAGILRVPTFILCLARLRRVPGPAGHLVLAGQSQHAPGNASHLAVRSGTRCRTLVVVALLLAHVSAFGFTRHRPVAAERSPPRPHSSGRPDHAGVRAPVECHCSSYQGILAAGGVCAFGTGPDRDGDICVVPVDTGLSACACAQPPLRLCSFRKVDYGDILRCTCWCRDCCDAALS